MMTAARQTGWKGLRSAALALAVLLLAPSAQAEWTPGVGEYLFPTQMPEADACRIAEEKAKQAALIRALGERLAVDDVEVCQEKSEDASCALGRLVWAASEGEVRALRGLRSATTATPTPGIRQCRVSLEADVVRWRGEPDPAFQFALILNQTAFRDGEAMTVTVEPSQPMYLAVFQWLPYERRDRQVQRLFPNAMDKDDRITGRATIPSTDGARRYSLDMEFPKAGQAHAPLVSEYLLAVGSRKPVPFRDSYGLEEFKALLLEIPRSEARLVRKGYAIVRPQ
ncbi:DUF4384 domain-containing protein [Paramagnetospirillum magneticum]|uniref:DUF4384 domain-containing protein n=1 Tax=Paramagnetospirillum magneticum (strain ATCC 700264 / AMB-1) TaxID=342108 RepID=Q2W6K5_PARM1|nr:DUF4384 domain-containing protein [Paramagnetospirillum magneticum]BAE50520.1 hypothetical protein amb1716 [Paramagnetospirillum magneticum AMB-1]